MRWLILTLLFVATTINYLDRGMLEPMRIQAAAA
jgi:hypothetical protein